jgi:hypothetical protein
MPKQKPPDDKLPKDEAERARDEALRRMLKTPPKPHKEEPKKGSAMQARAAQRRITRKD